MPSFEELTSVTSFNDFTFRVKTDTYSGKQVQSIRVFRVSYNDLTNNSLNLNSLNSIVSTIGSSTQSMKLKEFFLSKNVVNYNVKNDEVILQYHIDIEDS